MFRMGKARCHEQLVKSDAPTSATLIPRYMGFLVRAKAPDECKGEEVEGPPIIGVAVCLKVFLALVANRAPAMKTGTPKKALGLQEAKMGAAFGHKTSFPAAMIKRAVL